MEPVHLGIDLGTSSVKALVIDAQGRTLGSARGNYPVLTPRVGEVESDPNRWWEATREVVEAAVSDAGARPTGIGVAGQMHGVVVVDAHGAPLRPALLWPDTRAQPMMADYLALEPGARRRLGNPLVPGMAGPMLRWLAVHEPAVNRAVRWSLQPKDWLRSRLTGTFLTEPSDASATLLYDVIDDHWDHEVITALGLDPARFPPVAPSTSVAGELTADAARQLGLDAGLPVTAGAADTAAAAIGTGLVEPGPVQLTIGTGGQLVTPQAAPTARPEAGTHLYRSALPRGWYSMAAILNAGLALDWVRRLYDVEWPELYAAASTPVRGDDPIFCPHLVGERTPYFDAALRGGWFGLGLGHQRPALMRSALEGVAFALRDAFDALPVDRPVPHLTLAGGGSGHPAWQQLLADVLDRPLHSLSIANATARGAALLSAVACRDLRLAEVSGPLSPSATPVADPRPEPVALHGERFERYRQQIEHNRTTSTR